jgi:hypothetical protein
MRVRLDEKSVFFGVDIPLDRFESLALIHFREVPGTSVIEDQARMLAANDFPRPAVADFVTSACRWGGYAGVFGRILRDNDVGALRRAFVEAARRLAAPSPNVAAAIQKVSQIKGLGQLSFASKHLRFLRPDLCPVFDSRLQAALFYSCDSTGYASFAEDCLRVGQALAHRGAVNPWPSRKGQWYAADVEAAIFAFVQTEAGVWR